MKNKVEIFVNRLIDSVWTIVAIVDEENNSVEVLEYSREIALGYNHESKFLAGDFKETEGRIVQELDVYTKSFGGEYIKTYKVSNPKYIFHYSR